MALSSFAEDKDILTPIAGERYREKMGLRTAQNHEKAFREFAALDFLRLVKNRKMPYKWTGHETADSVCRKLGWDRFRSLCKIAIVRNPFDVVKSLYYFEKLQAQQRNNGDANVDFITWARRNPTKLNWNRAQYFAGSEFCIDVPIRYEHIKEDLMNLERRFPYLTGVEEAFSAMRAKSGITPNISRATFFAKAPDIVGQIENGNAEIIERFGYSLD